MDKTMNKGLFTPINKAHAIVEVIFYIQFDPHFQDQTIRRLIEVEHELKGELPKSSPVNRIETTIEIENGVSKVQSIEKPVGIHLQRIKPDGSVEWMLRTTENVIGVHCLEYSTWDAVWEQANRYFLATLKQIEGESNFISSVGLKYVDRFLYEGVEDKYDSSLLFNKETDLIAKKAFSASPLWHCHIGWFEKSPTFLSGNLLNKINIDSVYANISGRRRSLVTIEHDAIIQIEDNVNNGKLSSITDKLDDDDSCLDKVMGKLHMSNKDVLRNLLTEQMAKRICLG